MRRREFIAGLGGATAWQLTARAQQRQRLRRIATLGIFGGGGGDPTVFAEALAQAGWIEGLNIGIEHDTGDAADAGSRIRLRASAADIVAKSPDVIVSVGTQSTAVLKQLTNTIPVVFVQVADPVANGLVASFAHPGGNITGFTGLEFSLAGKWLSLLRDLAPGLRNVMLLYDPNNANWQGYLQTLEAGALSLGVSIRAAPARDTGEIERQVESFAHQSGAGMIVVPSGPTNLNREPIAALAVRHRLPAIYPYRFYATSGGLASYGPDTNDVLRRAAQYVDRILRGEKPADLPVQAPIKFEFVINLQAAKAISLNVSPNLLLLADDVIQ